ncbi:MAG TPA: UDP-4-amino-4,6-dideoxy-N-acetyl-beta-L-altrosamine transaminase [Micavibrio sp.]|nr:UDP-4-amino-4,6-dideoxy-N-acetyl-beta-L-altrosamine transaminase [Micavibrio sp.]
MKPAVELQADRPFLPYGCQTIEADDIAAVAESLSSDYLTTGPKVAEFEKEFCKVVRAKHCIVVGNGTHALHLACLAAGLGEGDYAIVPSVTFLATANAVRYCGADVLFADVDPSTGLMRPEDALATIEKNPGKKIKAILPVHLTGQTADLKALREISDKRGMIMIADAAHAVGSISSGLPVGAGIYEHMSIFSFHPVKTIALGEGGAITTNDDAMAKKMRTLRGHGMEQKPEQGPWFYTMENIGYNYRVTDFQCALGLSQLAKLDRFILRRRAIVDIYDTLLADLAPVILPPQRVSKEDPAWHLYAVRVDFKKLGMTRAELMTRLRERNIGTQVHYIPVSSQPYYTGLYGQQNLPGASHYYEHTLSLPLFPKMEDSDAAYVVETLKEICGGE